MSEYDPYTTPPNPDPERSRFERECTPAGQRIGNEGTTVARAYSTLLGDRIADSAAFFPPPGRDRAPLRRTELRWLVPAC